jgi:tripartite-type tricarboxylate transporter receptor subunit TctC
MKLPRRQFLHLAASAATFPAFSRIATAQTYPTRPVRLVVPYPPGGNVDIAARVVGDKLQALLGQPFVVENKAGAGGMLAGEMVAKSPADGYTLFVSANGPLLFSPEIMSRRAYEWRRDFVAIGSINFTPIILEVNPALPVGSVKDLFGLARNAPGTLIMASPGAGTSNHLLSEMLQARLGLKWTTVQYRGNAPATNDLIAGHVQFAFDQISVALPFVMDRKLRALAVASRERIPWLPDVPTFTELGYQDVEALTFTGLFAPAGTPKEIIGQLADALAKDVSDGQVVEKFAALGSQARAMTPADFTAYLENEDRTWIPVIRSGGIRADQ